MFIKVAADAKHEEQIQFPSRKVKNNKLTNGRIGRNDHDISIGCKHIDESRKVRVSHFHRLKLCC